MTDTAKGPGTFVSIYSMDSMFQVREEYSGAIDAAVSQWVDSGGSRDTLLDLETTEGMELRILASTITAWMVSTPTARRRMYQLNKAANDERAAMRSEAGLPPDDGAGW